MNPILLLIATAAASDADVRTLDYKEALEAALAHSPALVGARLDVDAADGALLAAKGTFDPSIEASTSQNKFTSESTREFGEVLSEFDRKSWSAGVNQLLPTGTNLGVDWSTSSTRFKYELRDSGFVVQSEDPLFESRMVATLSQSILEGHRLASNLEGVRSAARGRDIAQANRRAVRQQTLADTASAYWNTRTQRRLAEIAAAAVETAREEQRIVHAKVELGTLAPVERARVDAAVIQARRELLTAQDMARNTEDSLLLLIGENPGVEIELTTEPAEPTTVQIDVDAVERIALENNAELHVARIQEHSAEMARLDARHRLLPQLDVNASYALIGYEPSSSAANDELFSGDLPEWTVGATFSMPLLGRADRGQAMQRAAEAAKARSQRSQVDRQIRSQVRTLVRAVEAASVQVSLGRANLDLAQQTLAAERALGEAGRIIQKDLLESMAAVDDARTQLEQAKGDYQLALIELERLKGTL
jgi:outer membrane protein TolC